MTETAPHPSPDESDNHVEEFNIALLPEEMTEEQVEGLEDIKEAFGLSEKMGRILVEATVELEASRLEVEETQAELEKTKYDELTGLPNFKEFVNVMESRSVENSANMWVGFIDMDKFKQVNDTLGHAKADEILQELGQVLADKVDVHGSETAFGARRTGDEFLVGINGADTDRIREISEKLNTDISNIGYNLKTGEIISSLEDLEDDEISDDVQQVTASIGFVKHDQSKSIKESVDEADEELRNAKNEGRNRTVIKSS